MIAIELKCLPVLPNLLQFSPNERVESAKGRNGNEQRDEERADHVVAEEVPQRISGCYVVNRLLPVDGFATSK